MMEESFKKKRVLFFEEMLFRRREKNEKLRWKTTSVTLFFSFFLVRLLAVVFQFEIDHEKKKKNREKLNKKNYSMMAPLISSLDDRVSKKNFALFYLFLIYYIFLKLCHQFATNFPSIFR